MKNILPDLTKKMEEARQIFNSKKDEGMKKLEELRIQFPEEIDKYLENFYKRRNLIKEAFKQKLQLRKTKIGVLKQLFTTNIRFVISIPFIYSMIIPALIFHLSLEFYHRICFPLYGVKPLKTRKYFVFDRHHLSYLNWLEKFNCIYCSYFNCLVAYAREIGALTELYWCPIKHARRVFGTHDQYHLFVDYLEGEKYRKKITRLQTIAKKGGLKKPKKN
jgi:hypothetical protein